MVAQSESGSGTVSFDPLDARSRIVHMEQKQERELVRRRRVEQLRAAGRAVTEADEKDVKPQTGTDWEVMMYVLAGFVMVLSVTCGIVWVVLKFSGDD